MESPYGLPLPDKLVKVLSEEDIGSRDLLIVGDVHGCCDELAEMMDTHAVNSDNTCVLFVGDLVNKGDKSLEVVRYVRAHDWYSVRGNHDEICLKELQTSKRDNCALPLKFAWMSELSQEEEKWMSELPYAIHIPSRQIIVVHAGLHPELPLESQTPDMFLHMRCVKESRDENRLLEWTREFNEKDKLWGKLWPGPQHVFFGHDARRLFQQEKFATGLDTACVYGIELTGIYPLGRQCLTVKSHREPHPKYEGKKVTTTNTAC